MADWTEIVRQHGAMVWQTVFRLVNNDADAADCFQNTFMSALEVSRSETVRSWPALLKRLATLRAVERLRQRYRQIHQSTVALEDSERDHKTLEPSHAAQGTELAEHLRVALSHLDDKQAQVFCLACLEECSYQEIANQLDVTVNHVGVLLNRARAQLQKQLEGHKPEVPEPPQQREVQP